MSEDRYENEHKGTRDYEHVREVVRNKTREKVSPLNPYYNVV